ncbi:Spb1 C-terminal domain-containing protein [Phakopsora pachyrhizi]|uniref:Spb1 C-terminal domain-domain-containing protein n=1 Tax=Phakopsora pachyrhizi TaxID=170000 RepID=A0AAV0AEM7_PHAPC|nr:Spb1 C-terminal domain-containing protein [Phakopsora pachyrhizi]CAH7666535.1 Spb1 C-terminal domain-domain-containing protein [Phakopsora pachyrhizi]
MGKREKKTGKGRLDKYYKLAKEQGYRARSAFKLIQLNKRYQFLESARCCIDLCAAPGGWLQVASKWMPPNSLILGVDLVPIKPIPRVVTAAEDIRTDRCRRWLRSELKDWKADVVLHDGAPNVGTAWVQDAYSQSELVLHSLKLATEMLAHGGYFITKVFRSKDYHSLLYVFNQLFKTVEATKPPSSRNVSAEIFVVCQGFLAPKKIDPKLLDPAHVFKDLDLSQSVRDQAGPSSGKLTPNVQNVFKPEKKRRMRDGYGEGDLTLHKSATVSDFIRVVDPISILGVMNTINFSQSEEDAAIYKLKATTSEIKSNLKDLKVLGKGDFKRLLKWRVAVRELLGIEEKSTVGEAPDKEVAEPLDENVVMEQELLRLQQENALKKKRERRRLNEKRTRDVQRMQLQMTTPMDIGLERADDEIFDLMNMENHELSSDREILENYDESDDSASDENSEVDTEESDQEELSDREIKLNALEESLGEAYDDYQENQLRKDTKKKAREEALKQKRAQERELEWNGCTKAEDSDEDSDESIGSGDDIEAVRRKREYLRTRKRNDDDDDDSDSDGEDVTQQAERIMAARKYVPEEPTNVAKKKILVDLKEPVIESVEIKNRATDMWFNQPVFKGVSGIQELLNVKLEDRQDDVLNSAQEDIEFEDDDLYMQSLIDESSEETEASEKLESDIWEEKGSDTEEKNAAIIKERGLLTPQVMQLALSLVNREKTKDQLIDSGFRRDAFFDDKDNVPDWFLDDEMRHFREHVPVTKEAVRILRDKMRALDARPIKKVAEAKGRKKLRSMRRLQKAQSKANALNETSDLTEKEKSMEIEKLMSKLNKNPKKKNEIKLVVAKGVNKGQKGRPRGVKGRYKMVDPRGKKELRAQKRKLRKSSKSSK